VFSEKIFKSCEMHIIMRIKIKVKANSPNNEVIEKEGYYEVNVKEKPEKGKANSEIIKLFKRKFKKNVRIVSGFKSKEKILELT